MGSTWTPTDEPSFRGWAARDLMTLADGRLFAAGDAALGQGDSAMAVWIGEAAPVPSGPQVGGAFDTLISMLGPSGEVSPEMALEAFALAVAPLPGVTPPAGAPGHLDADTAVAWVSQVWDQLSPARQTAIEQALEAMPDPFQDGSGATAVAFHDTLADLQPGTAVAERECARVSTDPADVSMDDPAVQPYLERMQQAAASIAGHLRRPSLPRLAVCLMPTGTLAAPALTRVFDAQGARVGLPSSCSVFLNADTIGGLGDADVGYLMAFETFFCLEATADPTESLASSGARRIPPWVQSGAAAWAGATVATELFGGAGDRLTELWTRYLTEPEVSLYQRTTDAIGFFAQVDRNQPTAWTVLDDAVRAGDTVGAFDALTGRRQSFIDQWAAGYFRDASRGPDWDIVGPGIPGDTAEAGSIEISNGEYEEMVAASMAVATADLSTSADITTFASNHLRIHDGVQDLKHVRNQAYCTREGGSGACACPTGTPGAGRSQLPPLGTEVKLALTGMEWSGTAEIRGISLEEYCGPAPSVAPVCTIGIPAGEYDGPLVYTSVLPGHPPIHEGSGKIRFAVDADGTVTGSWALAYKVRSFTGQRGTGKVSDGVVAGTPRKLLLHGTVVTTMKSLGRGPVVPWPDTPLTVQPVCDGQVVAGFRAGGTTVIVRASPLGS